MANSDLSSEGTINLVMDALLKVISKIPESSQLKSMEPATQARALTMKAAGKSAAVSGTLAIPPGPAGMVTIIPDLMSVWSIQSQLVADIAAAYGRSAALQREQMLYCLFKHAAAQAFRDLVVRVGGRVVVKRASLRVIQNVLRKVGIRVTQRIAGKAIGRWLPVVGALGIAAYSYFDTTQVGKTAQELFSQELRLAA